MINWDNIKSQLNVEELYNKFLWLDQKQQYFVVLALAAVLIVILILPVNWISSQLNSREAEYREVIKTASELYDKLTQYNGLKNSVGKSANASAGVEIDIKKIVIQMTDTIGLDRHKATLKTIPDVPKGDFIEEGKEITLRNIDFEQTVQLLDQIISYSEVPLRVNKLTMQADRRNKQQMNTVVMTVSVLKPVTTE
ncbi:MAG: hypothetical protein ACD_62C00135G0006 [uncultured bacterium]|nr:MAG: hypothetical protein ACD_62C00135G0006 [uncultured bacterium]HLD44149.1 hypothetical protein [bacterium]